MKKIIYTSLAAFAALVINGCEKSPTDIIDSVDSYITIGDNYSLVNYSLNIQVIDGADAYAEIQNVTVTVEGRDAAKVFESGGTRNFQAVKGNILFVISPSDEPEADADIEFNVKISAPGYLPVNVEAFFREGELGQSITIPMVNLSNPPAGVANTTQNFTLTGNQLATAQSVSVLPSGDKATGATVSIPAGTKFYNTNGTQLTGGALEVSLTHFDAEGETSQACFPGGFNPRSVINEEGEEEEVTFLTAGFASIDLTVGGGKVRSFSQPVSVTMTISDTNYNLDTEAPIVAGDHIPVWSYEVETGVWQYEQDAVVQLVNGELTAQFDITHLSWYNLDFKGSRCSSSQSRGSVTINVPGASADTGRYFFCDVVFSSNGQSVSDFSTKTYYIRPGDEIIFYNAPYTQCKFRVYSGSSYYNRGSLLAQTTAFRPCQDKISLQLPANLFPTPISFKGTASCESGTIKKPSFYLYYRPVGASYWDYLAYVYKGEFTTTKLTVGQAYEFNTTYNNRYYETTWTVQSANNVVDFTLDAAACQTLFGSN